MSRGERSRAPIRERRQKYSAPDLSRIRETTLPRLLPRQRVLPAAQWNLFKSDGQAADERVVWYAGDAALLERPCVAVVGTREASSEGRAQARRLGRELAEHGVVVVSGLAKGIDTEALTAAISAGGVVVAVIGTPIDRAYPAENAPLQEKIAAEHLLISQFASGSRTFPSSFPVRNRLMAALSGRNRDHRGKRQLRHSPPSGGMRAARPVVVHRSQRRGRPNAGMAVEVQWLPEGADVGQHRGANGCPRDAAVRAPGLHDANPGRVVLHVPNVNRQQPLDGRPAQRQPVRRRHQRT